VIIGQSEIARSDLLPFSVPAKAIGEVLSAANRAAELIAQLRDYTGRSWFELKSLDLSAAVWGMSERIRVMAPPQIEIDFDLARDLPTIQCAPSGVQQVLQNVMANAVEAIGESRGTIRVRTSRVTLGTADLSQDFPDQSLFPGTYVQLEVSDSGGGVSTELASSVFDPFFTTKFLGRGLGLSAVQGIMRAHGGGVRFNSSTGRGACVQAIFPAENR
jgi:signal transduction histidine kinase